MPTKTTSLSSPAFSDPAWSGPTAARPASSAPAENDFSAHVFPMLGESGARRSREDDGARIERQWRARGHAAGYTEGLRAAAAAVEAQTARQNTEHAALMLSARQQLDNSLAVLQAAVRALDARIVPVVCDAEDSVLTAAMDLAEAVVGHALADEAAAARFALGRAGAVAGVAGSGPATPGPDSYSPGTHTVRLNPLDLALIDPADRARAGVEFVADAGLARGDAVSEFPHGFLDARIGSALDRAKAALGARAS